MCKILDFNNLIPLFRCFPIAYKKVVEKKSKIVEVTWDVKVRIKFPNETIVKRRRVISPFGGHIVDPHELDEKLYPCECRLETYIIPEESYGVLIKITSGPETLKMDCDTLSRQLSPRILNDSRLKEVIEELRRERRESLDCTSDNYEITWDVMMDCPDVEEETTEEEFYVPVTERRSW